jgi:hypothetical protein
VRQPLNQFGMLEIDWSALNGLIALTSNKPIEMLLNGLTSDW